LGRVSEEYLIFLDVKIKKINVVFQASPVVVRELGTLGLFDSRLVCVFGRDTTGYPKRCTVLCGDGPSKDTLVKEISDLLS
jgi:hypothetical protein